MQSRDKLRKMREKLGSTQYYDYWSDNFLREVLADDYELQYKRRETMATNHVPDNVPSMMENDFGTTVLITDTKADEV